ncbi:MAG: glycosyltransferase family 4 protein [Rudaea sp.]
MRLLHVMQRYWPAVGGAERYWQEISERAAHDGDSVQVYTTNAQDIELFWEPGRAAIGEPAAVYNGVQIRRFPVRHLFPSAIGYRAIRRALAEASDLNLPLSLLIPLAQSAPYCPDLARALRDAPGPFDLIAGVNIVYEGLLFAALECARADRIPFVLCPFTHLGEPGNRSVGRFYTMRHQVWLSSQSDAVFVSTDSEAEFYRSRGVSPERMITMGSGVTPEKILGGSGQRGRDKFGLERPLILFIGTVSTDKGARQSVEAMAELMARGVDAELALAGTPLDEFRRFYAGLPEAVRARCHLLGVVSDEDKKDLLDACRVLVLPSRTDLFPTVYLEGWLYEKPVIGARAGGVPDVIDHEQDGLLVDFGDGRGMADALARLLEDSALSARMGEKGCAKVYARYTWDRLYGRARAVYERLVARESIAELSWANEQ